MRGLVRTNREPTTRGTRQNTRGTNTFALGLPFVLFVFCFVPFVYLPRSASLSVPHQFLKKRHRAGFPLGADGREENTLGPAHCSSACGIFHVKLRTFFDEELYDVI